MEGLPLNRSVWDSNSGSPALPQPQGHSSMTDKPFYPPWWQRLLWWALDKLPKEPKK
jgi:hypothetical protein